MPKINVYLPDELAEAVKDSGVPVSAICQRALEQAVRRVTAIREAAIGDLTDDDPTARLTHFTQRARDTLKLGVRQARSAGSQSVGTEHLLGGIIAEGGNLALHVLKALEIEPEQVAGQLAALSPADPVEEGAGQRFSGHAANALELAVVEANSLGHNYIGCEHLLLGLVAEPDGRGGQVLRALGAEPRLTRRAVSAALAGYVHLRAQTSAPDPSQALAAAIGRAVEPLVARIDRLEARLDTAG